MVTTLRNATADTCGGKAAALAALLHAGLPVPDGFVVPFAAYRAARSDPEFSVSEPVRQALARHLGEMGDPPVAVRSSAADEDTAGASAAGQYESVLAVRGTQEVAEAVQVCWASSSSERATGYRNRLDDDAVNNGPDMAVLVQRLIDADVSGVMFTPTLPEDSTRIEATWGLGVSIVGGTVTPDAYEVAPDGSIRRTLAHKTTRLDRTRHSTGVAAYDVPQRQQTLPTLDDATAAMLAALGRRIAGLLGQPQDIEWAIADGEAWILQARPITATLPSLPARTTTAQGASLVGSPGAHGVVTGVARVLHSPSGFARVQPGDIVICPYTDPAWTPLFHIAAAVVTETGGVLSHAAIVAREHGIPAVLGVPEATMRIRDGDRITVDGTEGIVTTAQD
ncbi:PEP/pyruvate-binding domain-containing protein [Micropruina sonneratiae]|uniref:PEP/pyruvate-binding domain-containing protein n=1 Tax=Micropruina sonneratiae TaxID=2986940 RepID=UPI0022262CDD|nr:PEP/pyruvate-binding domain-containing protein [Micropruina sp. KQZ13P-5]MCW3158378.1 PEP-utilizing enzyme [Micropruina sp. KQZ13P-5]